MRSLRSMSRRTPKSGAASNSVQIVFALADGTQTELAFLKEPGTYVPIGQPDGWRLSSAEATPGAPEDNGALTFPYVYSYSLGSALSVSTLWLTQEYPTEGLDPIFAAAPVLTVDRHEARVHDAGDNKLLVSWMIDGEAAGVSTIRVTATLWNVDPPSSSASSRSCSRFTRRPSSTIGRCSRSQRRSSPWSSPSTAPRPTSALPRPADGADVPARPLRGRRRRQRCADARRDCRRPRCRRPARTTAWQLHRAERRHK